VYDTEPLYRNQMYQTRIGYETNLTHSQTVRYLRMHVDLGLLILMDSKSYPYYRITEKGHRCLQLFGELEEDLKIDDATPSHT
ncbi:MAG: winged helix-turn-helix domain-containing protein, partial [Nitrososphaeraceae archaeon]